MSVAFMEAIGHSATINIRVVSLCILIICAGFCASQTSEPARSCVSSDGQRSYECVSRQCLKCVNPVDDSDTQVDQRTGFEVDRHPANCTYDPVTSTLSCVPDTSNCTIQTCSDPCKFCLGQYHKLPGVPLTGDSWTFTSHCATLPTDIGSPDCNSSRLFYSDRCFGQRDFNERADVLSGKMGLFGLNCGCFELNCTAGMAEIKFKFDSPMNPSGGSENMTTPTSRGRVAALSDIVIVVIIIVVLFGVFIVACLTVALVVCARNKLKSPRNVRPITPIHYEDQLNDQPWRLINQIGQGRYGYVYKAQYQGNIVALKIFSHNGRTAWETECTLNSMESTAHENILEFVTKESRGAGISLQLVIITKYYQLGSLNQFLRKHVVSLQQANVMISSIANGLAHLHAEYYTNSCGIMTEKYAIAHRDMKSANVLVKNENGDCVIGDLGFAMILDPSLDSKQLASTGQVGTFRYMAPEVLDTRVHLLDLQSFKQIDVYAFSLIMWEIMSRCSILNAEDVPQYQLPFEDLVGIRPSLDTMKDLVVTRKLRPSLPPMWANDEHLNELHESLAECWDEDPEARLSAANIVYRMEEFTKAMFNLNDDDHPSSSAGTTTQFNTMATCSNTMAAMTQIGQPMECSQSSPPPYYSPTDPNSFQNVNEDYPGPIPSPSRQHFFPTSMPHINQGSGCGTGSATTGNTTTGGRASSGYGYNQPTRTFRNSACSDGGAIHMNVYNSHEALSVRNSLILTEERRPERETEFGGGRTSLLYEQGSLDEIQGENEESSVGNLCLANGSGLDMEDSNLNSDSGVQNINSSSVTSASMDSSSNNSSFGGSSNSVVSNLSDELFNKRQLPESSTDTLDLDHQGPSAAVSNYGGAPGTNTTTDELGQVMPVENSGNSVSTVTSV